MTDGPWGLITVQSRRRCRLRHLAADSSQGSFGHLLHGLPRVELKLFLFCIYSGICHCLGLDLRCDLLEVLVFDLHRRHLEVVLVLTGKLGLHVRVDLRHSADFVALALRVRAFLGTLSDLIAASRVFICRSFGVV